MLLVDVLKETQWKVVKRVLSEAIPDCRRALPRYRAAYKHMRTLSPLESTMRICLDVAVPEKPDDPPWLIVTGRDGKLMRDQPDFQASGEDPDSPYARSEVAWAIHPVPWSEWLGMAIDTDTLARCSSEEIAAHCLWEMTWDGFDEETIRKEWERLSAR